MNELLNEMVGKPFVSVENKNNEELIFTAVGGEKYIFWYEPD